MAREIYTNQDVDFRHLSDETDNGYDEKIESDGRGGLHHYTTKSNWEDHSHDHYDEKGNCDYSRGEGYGHSWREKDYIMSVLCNLSFIELQEVEAKSNNDYVKRSAQMLMSQRNYNGFARTRKVIL